MTEASQTRSPSIPCTRRSASTTLSAVSLPMYAILLLTAVLWSVYALLIGNRIIVVTNALISPCALFVAVKAWRGRYAPVVLAVEVP